jgi:hypothetical protein
MAKLEELPMVNPAASVTADNEIFSLMLGGGSMSLLEWSAIVLMVVILGLTYFEKRWADNAAARVVSIVFGILGLLVIAKTCGSN